VNCLNAHRAKEEKGSSYATGEDFRRLFKENAQSLYLLSFLLTANHEKAERCFVEGLDDCMEDRSVFQQWARSWARRIIIRNALRVIAPDFRSPSPAEGTSHSANDSKSRPLGLQDPPFAGILALQDFDRFVYVLSLLEGYADQNCAVLLGVSQSEVRETRIRACQQIVDFERGTTVRDVHLDKEQSYDGAK
jgi:hypothetical protein